jgi:hypothetical protein
MSGRILVLSAVFLGLAGCTDKIAMSSEVGGGRSSTFVSSIASPGGPGGAGTGSGGLGVTGGGGALENVLGADPVGGLLDAALGEGNLVTALLGSQGGPGLVPSAAGALAGDPDANVTGLGLLGDGGLLADLTGGDILGGAIDTSGVLGATLAGGNDGLLGALLDGQGALAPVAQPVAAALPLSTVTEGLSQVPALGVTGAGGLVHDLLGIDLVGNLVGTENPLGGGNGGLLGNLIPAGEPPLAPVGSAVTGLLGVVAGSQPSPLAGDGALGPALPGLNALLTGGNNVVGGIAAPAHGALSSVPVVGNVLGTPAAASGDGGTGGALSSVPVLGDALGPVTGSLGSLPLLGGLLGGR